MIPKKTEKNQKKSILKVKSNSSKDLTEIDNQPQKEREIFNNRQYRQSKSVQINDDDSIYGNYTFSSFRNYFKLHYTFKFKNEKSKFMN